MRLWRGLRGPRKDAGEERWRAAVIAAALVARASATDDHQAVIEPRW
jgi:hypothetical protein